MPQYPCNQVEQKLPTMDKEVEKVGPNLGVFIFFMVSTWDIISVSRWQLLEFGDHC